GFRLTRPTMTASQTRRRLFHSTNPTRPEPSTAAYAVEFIISRTANRNVPWNIFFRTGNLLSISPQRLLDLSNHCSAPSGWGGEGKVGLVRIGSGGAGSPSTAHSIT